MEYNVFSCLLSPSASDEGVISLLLGLSHLLLLGLLGLLHVLFSSVKHFLLFKLVKKVSDVPPLHVTELITSPDNS